MTVVSEQVRTCNRCGRRFSWSTDDEEFFTSRGYAPPSQCRICRWVLSRMAAVSSPGPGAPLRAAS